MRRLMNRLLYRAGILLVYAAVAGGIYLVHGSQPPLSVDHIAYMKLANDIRHAHPDGRYFEGFRSAQSYGVLLALLYPWTSDHIRSMKMVLAVLTFLELWAFEYLMYCFTQSRLLAVLFAILSIFHVSFGAVFWGMTSFEASLSRSLIIPPILLVLGYYLRNEGHRRRILVFPALVYLSVIHLSSLYILATLFCYEGLLSIERWFRKERSDLSGLILEGLFTLLVFIQVKPWVVPNKISRLFHMHFGSAAPAAPMVSSQQAWATELFAQPWRNFPPPPATLLMISASAGVIILLSAASVWLRRRSLVHQDRQLLRLAACTVFCAYGLQLALWVLRSFMPVYPYNFEEVRLIGFLAIPMIILVFKLVEHLWNRPDHRQRRWAILVIALFLMQPIFVVQSLPKTTRTAINQWMIRAGLVENYESLRSMYARSILKLEDPSTRFYYSMAGIIKWLEPRVSSKTVILTDRSELYLLNAQVIGSANAFLNKDVRTPQRQTWMRCVLQLHDVLSRRDESALEQLMKDYHADFAVVPWNSPKAEFTEGRYSIIAQ